MSTPSISAFRTLDTVLTPSCLGFRIVFRSLVLPILRVLAIFITLEYSRCTLTMKYTGIAYAPFRSFHFTVSRRKHLQVLPSGGVGVNHLRGGDTGGTENTGRSQGSILLASIRNMYGFCTVDTACTLSIFGFDTAGTAGTRSTETILPVLAFFWGSVLWILQVFVQFWPLVFSANTRTKTL